MEDLILKTDSCSATASNYSTDSPSTSIRHCSMCQTSVNCCYRAKNIVVLPRERDLIVSQTQQENAFRSDVDSDLYLINKRPGEPCPFLSVNHRCGIYESRPLDCRAWPITRDSQTNSYIADMDCGAIPHGLTKAFFEYAEGILNAVPSSKRIAFFELATKGFALSKFYLEEDHGGE